MNAETPLERGVRLKLPDNRQAITHRFNIDGHIGFITVGLFADGQPGEVSIVMAKTGSTIHGLMKTIATLLTLNLQYGVPIEELVRELSHYRYYPNGFTKNPEIPRVKSITDYIFRWMGIQFIPGYRASQ